MDKAGTRVWRSAGDGDSTVNCTQILETVEAGTLARNPSNFGFMVKSENMVTPGRCGFPTALVVRVSQ